MTKKVYTKPELKSEAFVPQTHVAACGDSGTVYKFTCDAPRGTLYYFRDKPASGSQPTIGNRGIWLGNYHPCSAFHEAEAQSGFYWGYVDYNHINPEKPDVPLNKNDAFQKVQKRRVQEKR